MTNQRLKDCFQALVIAMCIAVILYAMSFYKNVPTLSVGYTASGNVSLCLPDVLVRNIDCSRLFAGDKEEMMKARIYQITRKPTPTPDAEFANVSLDCEAFKRNRGYINRPLSVEEEQFPLAYSIVMYKDVAMAERLLRAIYQPHNYYCIHIDASSKKIVKVAMKAISDCFDNVFIASKNINIVWGL